ncbi:hypothetical protein PSm6_00130 [Pseudomonas solani]|uniref:Phage ABA sandwich domain-containing protein n=1 Tax=Pseudomonas solani TaxID=2731552 RepID=A0ABN6BJW6_9PSED|nr:hypothetical protein [Pseudomonas solani]BCD83606.1 hypothetical protein PSm6_00130 [Pseudomonas solani]
MKDIELLELAARAAGFIELRFDPDGRVRARKSSGVAEAWDPLVDDGDALRLAVRLQLTVCNEHVTAGVTYCVGALGDITYPEVRSGNSEADVVPDDYAATRRAIVLAAAEIGKAMK